MFLLKWSYAHINSEPQNLIKEKNILPRIWAQAGTTRPIKKIISPLESNSKVDLKSHYKESISQLHSNILWY